MIAVDDAIIEVIGYSIRLRKADDEKGHWVTMRGRHMFIGSNGKMHHGGPKGPEVDHNTLLNHPRHTKTGMSAEDKKKSLKEHAASQGHDIEVHSTAESHSVKPATKFPSSNSDIPDKEDDGSDDEPKTSSAVPKNMPDDWKPGTATKEGAVETHDHPSGAKIHITPDPAAEGKFKVSLDFKNRHKERAADNLPRAQRRARKWAHKVSGGVISDSADKVEKPPKVEKPAAPPKEEKTVSVNPDHVDAIHAHLANINAALAHATTSSVKQMFLGKKSQLTSDLDRVSAGKEPKTTAGLEALAKHKPQSIGQNGTPATPKVMPKHSLLSDADAANTHKSFDTWKNRQNKLQTLYDKTGNSNLEYDLDEANKNVDDLGAKLKSHYDAHEAMGGKPGQKPSEVQAGYTALPHTPMGPQSPPPAEAKPLTNSQLLAAKNAQPVPPPQPKDPNAPRHLSTRELAEKQGRATPATTKPAKDASAISLDQYNAGKSGWQPAGKNDISLDEYNKAPKIALGKPMTSGQRAEIDKVIEEHKAKEHGHAMSRYRDENFSND